MVDGSDGIGDGSFAKRLQKPDKVSQGALVIIWLRAPIRQATPRREGLGEPLKALSQKL